MASSQHPGPIASGHVSSLGSSFNASTPDPNSTPSAIATFVRRYWPIALLIFSCWCVYYIRGALGPVIAAWLISYLIHPQILKMEKRGVKRPFAIGIAFFSFVAFVALISVLIIPNVVDQLSSFVEELPQKLTELVQKVEPTLNRYGVQVPHSAEEIAQSSGQNVSEVMQKALQPLTTGFSAVLGGTASLLNILALLLLVPMMVWYISSDYERIRTGTFGWIPPRHRHSVEDFVKEVDVVVKDFAAGQLIVMLIMGAMYAVGYSLAGVKLALPIGILAGVLTFIPYVGSTVAIALAAIMCIFDGADLTKWIVVLVVHSICQFAEGFIITPKIVGNKVGLSEIGVIVALLIFGDVFGFVGVLFAVPLAAILKVIVRRIRAVYEKSELYRRAPTRLVSLYPGPPDFESQDQAETPIIQP